jgi:hypothetical protein
VGVFVCKFLDFTAGFFARYDLLELVAPTATFREYKSKVSFKEAENSGTMHGLQTASG